MDKPKYLENISIKLIMPLYLLYQNKKTRSEFFELTPLSNVTTCNYDFKTLA